MLVVASLGGGGTPWALSFHPTPSIPLRIGRCDKLFVRTNRSVERFLGGWEAEEEAGLIHADGLTEGWVRPGTSDEMVVLREIMVPPEGFDLASALSRSGSGLDSGTCLRLDLSPANVTVPVALALLDPAEYPTLTRARKACRRGSVVIYAGQDGPGRRGKVADRIIPGDILGIQVRADRGAYSSLLGSRPPSFELDVLYEDDHMAVVVKPAGVVMYDDHRTGPGGSNGEESGGGDGRGGKKSRKRGHGRNTLKYALPHVLQPPSKGTESPLPRPAMCHRLDKPTSGLVVVAKTLPAVRDLTAQFEKREVRKSYAAICHGQPSGIGGNLTDEEADESWGVGTEGLVTIVVDDVATKRKVSRRATDPCEPWNLLLTDQEGREAVTLWRRVMTVPSAISPRGEVTLVDLRPRTGRQHQLRRHMAWDCGSALVGDVTYGSDAEVVAAKRWGRGLMLCSNGISVRHPYYGRPGGEGYSEWEQIKGQMESDLIQEKGSDSSGEWVGRAASLSLGKDGSVWLQASIDLPNKFRSFLATEGKRAEDAAKRSVE